MTKRKTKNGDMRMLAAMVESNTYAEFARVAKANERTVAAELRVLVRERIAEHDAEPTTGAAA